MNLLSSAWNYQPSAEIKKSVKSRAISAMIWLLALMICFTLISRATSSMTVPIVETDNPTRGSINHTVTVDGVLETARDTGIVVTENAVVTSVEVKEGDTVAAGDLLFTYDTADFDRQIADYQAQLAQINAQLYASGQQRALDTEQRSLARERAAEDLENTDVSADIEVMLAEEVVRAAAARVRTARKALEEYYDNDSGWEDEDYDDSQLNALRETLSLAEIAREEAELNREKVIAEKEQRILDAERIIEDTDLPETPNASEEVLRQDAQMINLKLGVLNEAVANEGAVLAPMGGVVTRVNVGAGTRTTSEAALFINDAGMMDFVTEVTRDEKKYVNTGNTATLRMAGETKDIEGLAVTSVQPSVTPNAYRVAIETPADYLPGTSGTAEIEQKSKSYDTVIPLSALHADGSRYYVMRVVENETSLGTECFAGRVDVTLREKNETYAAVTGALSGDDEIISSAESSIGDGDKVRLPDEE